MQKLEVFGAKKLKGQVKISGSKNASLPILASTLLSRKKIFLNNLPKVKDIETMLILLESLGSKIKKNKNKIIIDNSKQKKTFASYNLVKTMRAGILVLGPLFLSIGSFPVFDSEVGCDSGSSSLSLAELSEVVDSTGDLSFLITGRGCLLFMNSCSIFEL